MHESGGESMFSASIYIRQYFNRGNWQYATRCHWYAIFSAQSPGGLGHLSQRVVGPIKCTCLLPEPLGGSAFGMSQVKRCPETWRFKAGKRWKSLRAKSGLYGARTRFSQPTFFSRFLDYCAARGRALPKKRIALVPGRRRRKAPLLGLKSETTFPSGNPCSAPAPMPRTSWPWTLEPSVPCISSIWKFNAFGV